MVTSIFERVSSNVPLMTFFNPNPPSSAIGIKVVTTGINLVRNEGASYAFDTAPVSLLPDLSGNTRPGASPVRWLKNQNKCNQFVGEVLIRSGLGMPTWRMADGTVHFRGAESLPAAKEYFSPVPFLTDLAPGDIVVRDFANKSGDNGAHVEIVHSFNPIGVLYTLGARADGANLRDSSQWLDDLGVSVGPGAWKGPGVTTFLLRPKGG